MKRSSTLIGLIGLIAVLSIAVLSIAVLSLVAAGAGLFWPNEGLCDGGKSRLT